MARRGKRPGFVSTVVALVALLGAYGVVRGVSDTEPLQRVRDAFADSLQNERAEDGPLRDLKKRRNERRHKKHREHGKNNASRPHRSPAPWKATPKQVQAALSNLQTIPVKGRAPETGYDRDQFGSEWDDDAGNFTWTGNGLDTRNDVLSRALREIACEDGTETATGACEVLTGTLPYEPYTGTRDYRFDSTDDDYDTDLDIEHIVPLSWAWQHGAQQWSTARRAAYANAPRVLMATDPSQNRQHSDSGPGAWQPQNKAYRCTYNTRWVQILTRWNLWVNPADKKALAARLRDCV